MHPELVTIFIDEFHKEVKLYGELAALINLANGQPRSKGIEGQVTLIAGTRSHY